MFLKSFGLLVFIAVRVCAAHLLTALASAWTSAAAALAYLASRVLVSDLPGTLGLGI